MRISETLVDSALMLAMGRVKVVFDAVVRAARQVLGDVGPFVAKFFVEIKNFLFFHLVDRCFVNKWVKMIVPSGQKYYCY